VKWKQCGTKQAEAVHGNKFCSYKIVRNYNIEGQSNVSGSCFVFPPEMLLRRLLVLKCIVCPLVKEMALSLFALYLLAVTQWDHNMIFIDFCAICSI
jgi:hypothetical protein